MYRGDWRGAAVAVKLVSQAAPLDGALIAEFRRWAWDDCRFNLLSTGRGLTATALQAAASYQREFACLRCCEPAAHVPPATQIRALVQAHQNGHAFRLSFQNVRPRLGSRHVAGSCRRWRRCRRTRTCCRCWRRAQCRPTSPSSPPSAPEACIRHAERYCVRKSVGFCKVSHSTGLNGLLHAPGLQLSACLIILQP